jgi:hypothetical protein
MVNKDLEMLSDEDIVNCTDALLLSKLVALSQRRLVGQMNGCNPKVCASRFAGAYACIGVIVTSIVVKWIIG